jgi:hypothetical protein
VSIEQQCPKWVISGQLILGQNPPLSAVTPIADIPAGPTFVR